MELFHCLLLVLGVTFVHCQDTGPGTTTSIPPTVHQVLLLEPIPIANMIGRDFLRLECSASGNPAPTIEWSFNGIRLRAQDEGGEGGGGEGEEKPVINNRVTIVGNRLTIFKIKGKTRGDPSYYNSGRYRCVARNEVGSVFLEKNIQIRVMGQFKPGNRQKDETKKWNPTVGRNYQIRCPPHSFGHGTEYRWGSVPLSSNQPEYWLPGEKNKKLFYKLDGTLVWSVISHDDIKESRDMGGLRCILINFGQFAASNQQELWQPYDVVKESRKPILEAKLAPTMMAPVDSEFNLICGATGNPVPTYHWQYQGRDIVSRYNNSDELNFEFFQFLGNKMQLRIRRITRYSGGTFKCFAKSVIGEVWSIGQLSVSFPPKWIDKFPEAIDVPVGNSFELICNATGFPQPTIEWFQNSTRITTKDQRKIVTGDKKTDVGGKLILTTATYEDNGIYICVARNELDTLTMSVNIKIQAMKPVFRVPLDDPIYLFRSERMFIHCNPAGGPIPTKEWKKDGTAIKDDGHYKIHDNGTLEIIKVDDSDVGLYTCVATNPLGKAESSGTASVLNRTIINRPPENLNHAVHWGYTVLYCGAQWDERLDLRIEWYKGGVRMAKFSDKVYLETRAKGPPRLLYIKNLTIYDAGNYSCHAYTKVGNVISEQWSEANLRIKGAPQPPAGVSILSGDSCEDFAATLTWSRGEELNEETRYFFIEYSTNTSSLYDAWFGGKGGDGIQPIIAEPGTRVSYQLTKAHLPPGANLIFRIKAASQFLTGSPSRPSRSGTCITPPGVPILNPINVTGITRGPNTLFIKWNMMMDVLHGASGFYYEVFYKTPDAAAFTKQVIKDANKTEFEIPAPGLYKQYVFKVRSGNDLGPCEAEPKEVSAYSGADPPKIQIRGLRIARISRFTVNLAWDPVPEGVEGVRVRYYNVTDAEKFRGRSKRAATDPIKILYQYFKGTEFRDGAPVTNLTAQVQFIATVAAVNNGGIGPESSAITFMTEARVPGPPSDVKLVVYGNSIHLSWHPPVFPNGYIEQYVISWYESDKERRKKKILNQKISKDRRAREAYLIGIFQPFVYYDIKLMARNRIGPGADWQRERVVVSAPDIPGKGGAPKAVSFDDSKINITYQRPDYGGLPTKFFVYYRPKGHFFKTPKNMSQEFPHRAWILITDLEFLVYDFWTVGVNAQGISETSDVTEMQPIRRPKGAQAHASQFEWWRSNWFIAISMCVLFVLITMIVVMLLLRDGPVPYESLKAQQEKNGFHVASKSKAGVMVESQPMQPIMEQKPVQVEVNDDRRYLSTSDDPQSELEPPRYSSQSSIEKKEVTASEAESRSRSGSEYTGSESGSQTGSETGSETGSGSEYSDDDGSVYSDEEKKRPSSDEEDDDEENDDELAAFV